MDFWWRDDDAIQPTAQLDLLLDQRNKAGVPVLLAVIPDPAEQALFERLENEQGVAVSQHGFRHENHETKPAKAAELGPARPADKVLAELAEGKAKLERSAGRLFCPILTPPWNRIDADIARRRHEIGLPGLSTFGPATSEAGVVNAHLDMIAWKAGRGFFGWPKAARIAEEEISRRLETGSTEPFGLLTHHLVHDAAIWEFTECFLAVAASHPAARWPAMTDLFGIEARALSDHIEAFDDPNHVLG